MTALKSSVLIFDLDENKTGEVWAAIVQRHSQPVEIISQYSHSIGPVGVTATTVTFGRIK